MTQLERRLFLIKTLAAEESPNADVQIPESVETQKKLLRALMNVRMPKQAERRFIEIQNRYLKKELRDKGIVSLKSLTPVEEGIYLWQGDITVLKTEAIVNAANSGLLGCFYPCHSCVDNAIHTYAGIQLRLACAELMKKQGHEEAAGTVKITPAFNLPCKYILHTVGPIINGKLTEKDCRTLSSCYHSCLETADKHNFKSIAFCCISTGEFGFPNEKAADIAIDTVKKYKEQTKSNIEVVFNVFKDCDYKIYRQKLNGNKAKN